ncbi:Rod shape-determining protein MreD [Cytophagaceae bacterium ABcell3]|nr:Rod shape-determining protein MreD [Cytophagaceae bacterium ABcell3]
MKSQNTLKYFLYFLLFAGLQVVLFLNVSLFNVAFCFVYIGFILLLPIETSKVVQMLSAFAIGLVVDIFYDTLGIHAAASVLIAYIRAHVINLLTPRGGYDTGIEISVQSLGFQWFITYAGILVFTHHFALFFLEVLSISNFGRILLKTFASSIFTVFVITLLQYLFKSPKRI